MIVGGVLYMEMSSIIAFLMNLKHSELTYWSDESFNQDFYTVVVYKY